MIKPPLVTRGRVMLNSAVPTIMYNCVLQDQIQSWMLRLTRGRRTPTQRERD